MNDNISRVSSLFVVIFLAMNASVAICATPTTNPAAAEYTSSASAAEAAVSGTSTLHDWTVKGTVIKGTAVFSGELKSGAIPTVGLQSINLVIPVDSLKSTEGSGMDNTMYDALKFKQFPTISYTLTKASLKTSAPNSGPAYHFDTTGQLTVAGASHIVNLDLAISPHDEKQLTITTEIGLKMTDFGVKPPTAMLGMIKSGDAITVKVSWQLTVSPTAAKDAK